MNSYAPARPLPVAPHVHVCPLHVKRYDCPKVVARCHLRVRTVAECPLCAFERPRRHVRTGSFLLQRSDG
jgi:hypothetical protein